MAFTGVDELLAATTPEGVAVWLIKQSGTWLFGPVLALAWEDYWDAWEPVGDWSTPIA